MYRAAVTSNADDGPSATTLPDAADAKSATDSTAATSGHVSLVGAGPGHPGLITLRGRDVLGQADVVLYDALTHPALLNHAKAGAELVFAGKRAGRASARQSEINERLVEEAKAGKHVVRLKGGDPYLFGRGSEEAEALAQAGIPFEVVPGVPSPLAATAYAGISLTHRDLSSSVAYLTATESPEKDRSAHDWAKLATGTQTLVIFMGLRKLEHLMALLKEHGRPADTPVAVIQSASLPSQRTVVGNLDTIARRVHDAELGMPALTIVGPVVSLREHLRWFDTQPLFGKRVLVTRPEAQGAELCAALRNAGAEPVHIPTIRIVPPADSAPLEQAIENLHRYHWVLFTSRNGVDRFFAALKAKGGDARRLGHVKLAAIGPATAQALEAYGLTADLIPPDEFRGEALADAVTQAHGKPLTGAHILLPRAKVAREILPETLRDRGARVDVVPAYETVGMDEADRARLVAMLTAGELDVVTFTASSTVSSLVEVVGEDAATRLQKCQVVCIGPITADRARDFGIRVDAVATHYTNEGLLRALKDHFAGDVAHGEVA